MTVMYNNAKISEHDTEFLECWENSRMRKQCVPGLPSPLGTRLVVECPGFKSHLGQLILPLFLSLEKSVVLGEVELFDFAFALILC